MSRRNLIILIIVLIFLVMITISAFYYKGKIVITFETGTEETILPKYIKKNQKIEEPKTPIKDGYVFVEWQLDGEKYDFNRNINKNITLSAKWIKEEYVKVNYVTNSNYNIEPIKILKGTVITNLPIAYKDGYEFIGWYVFDKPYDGSAVNDDIVLTATYVKKEIKLKIGDEIKIVGSYAGSAYSTSSQYSMAYGWDRRIIDIIDGVNYPYMVGNENGVTGFFKADSLELLKKEL